MPSKIKRQRPTKRKPKVDDVQPRLFNREVSWLEFDRRVLEQAMEDHVPVLERLKFLSIFSSNLDEFFMIRVSGIKEQVEEGVGELSPDGLSPAEQLKQIRTRLRPMLRKQADHLANVVFPELEKAAITIEAYKFLDAKEKKKLDKYFRDNVFPILTPQSVDSSHPFPYISNLSLNLGLFIEPNRSATQLFAWDQPQGEEVSGAPELPVVDGYKLLDQPCFKKERPQLSGRLDIVDPAHLLGEAHPLVDSVIAGEVGKNTGADIDAFANVKNRVVFPEQQVDAGGIGQCLDVLLGQVGRKARLF
jgi:polyphosphate kinase